LSAVRDEDAKTQFQTIRLVLASGIALSDDERKKTNDISWCNGKRRPIKLRDYLPIITKLRVDHGGSPALVLAATVARNMSWW
jgi:hypothetical protein